MAPGCVRIVASAQGLTARSRQVDVVAAPLPIDRLQAHLAFISEDVEATHGADGALVSITLPVGGSAALDMLVKREGRWIVWIPYSLTSSNPDIARVDDHCRPPALDPHCDVLGNWGWVSGMAPGESIVTVTVRNMEVTFVVRIETGDDFPFTPEGLAGLYTLVTVEGDTLPTDGVESGSLTLQADGTFIVLVTAHGRDFRDSGPFTLVEPDTIQFMSNGFYEDVTGTIDGSQITALEDSRLFIFQACRGTCL